jgi:hypothetical protein
MNLKELLSKFGINIGSFILVLIAIYVIVECIISIPRKILSLIYKYIDIVMTLLISLITMIIGIYVVSSVQSSFELSNPNVTLQLQSNDYVVSSMGYSSLLSVIILLIVTVLAIHYMGRYI